MAKKPSKSKRKSLGRDVALELDVTPRTVQNWAAQGCPHDFNGGIFRYDLAEVAAWMKANKITGEPGRPAEDTSPDIEAAKLRKENALASKYELQVARERAALVLASDVKQEWARRISTAKSKFLGMPASVAPRLEGQNAASIQTELELSVTEILNELASGN